MRYVYLLQVVLHRRLVLSKDRYMLIKIKVAYYRYKAKVYLVLAKPFGWVNEMFHSKHVKALRKFQRYEAGFASSK